MNPSTALARVAIDQLRRGGVADFVLSPGSRSAPLALELAALERAGEIRLHVRLDERSAAFTALGIAKIAGEPAAVICTSGSAPANFLPAVIEASYAGIPLITVTADRPPELRNTGSNQTIDQPGLFSTMVRRSLDIPVAEDAGGQVAQWRAQIARAVATATADRGPVQINLGFREPLTPDGGDWHEPLDIGIPALTDLPARLREPISYIFGDLGFTEVPQRGVILAGDITDPLESLAAVRLARDCGWPIISEPSGNALAGPTAVPAAPLVLGDGDWLRRHTPEVVLTIGRFGLSRSTMRLVRTAKLHLAVSIGGRDRPDPLRTAAAMLATVPLPARADDTAVTWHGPDLTWNQQWQEPAIATALAVRRQLADPGSGFTSLHVAAAVLDSLNAPDVLFAAASRPVRDLELVARPRASMPRIIGNRGASGIDGLISTASGAAMALARVHPGARLTALIGDLAFLHDHNGMLTPLAEQSPPLTIVVPDNNGGGIFHGLEQGDPQFAADFERVFGTPHDRDLTAIARAAGAHASAVFSLDQLADALSEARDGLHVVVASTDGRAAEADLHRALAGAALGSD